MAALDAAARLRYSRHLALAELGEAGQARLAAARVLIVGLGGLGSPVALYLAAAGIGRLTLNEFDRVDASNLQRQILFDSGDIDQLKTQAARARLLALNPAIEIGTIGERLIGEALARSVAEHDLVIDGTDNFGTRFAVNAACAAAGKPLVSGAAIRFEGQVSVFPPGGPCYRCLYDETDELGEDCRGQGVLAPLVGVIGSVMAVEAIKLIAGIGRPLAGRLWLYDALHGDWRSIRLERDPACPVCGMAPAPG